MEGQGGRLEWICERGARRMTADRPIRRVLRRSQILEGVLSDGLRIEQASIPARAAKLLLAEFRYDNPARQKAERLGFWAGNLPRHVSTVEVRGPDLVIPRGGIDRAKKILEAEGCGLRFTRDFTGHDPVDLSPTSKAERIKLRPDQEEIVRSILLEETCLIRAAPGSGKTEAAIEAAVRIGRPTLVVVWSA